MGEKGTLWLPEQASTLAPEIDALFYFVMWTSVVLFVGVIGAMLYFAYKYRRRDPAERPELVEESKLVEISWIVIPTILVLIVFNWGFKTYVKMGVAPPDAYEVTVRAQQFYWEFEYPNGLVKNNQLHVPVGRPVKLKMSSTDVLHSFFVPAFRVKHDVLPNRYTSVWFEATETGTYQVFCTEYCGTQHSGMLAEVVVQTQDEFQSWLESGGGSYEDLSLPELGKVLYTDQQCQQCHSLDGSPKAGPTWEGLYGTKNHRMTDGSTVTVDENYLREAIVEPGAKIVEGYGNVMPASYSSLSERQVSALIEFMKQQSDKTLEESTSPSEMDRPSQ
jgi:cytochrome c oxidase subunit 2